MAKITVEKPERSIDGVNPEAAKKIEKMLKQGKRYFGSSGALMTRFAFSPEFKDDEKHNKTAAKEMLDGERDTTTFLKKWISNKPNAVLIDSIRIPGLDLDDYEVNEETGLVDGLDVDHAILIGKEVIIIDTKRWKKKKNYSVDDDGTALMTDKSFDGNEISMTEHIDDWLDYLYEDTCITGIVVVNQEEVTVRRNKNWYVSNYRLVEIDRFEELLDEKYKMIEDEDLEHISSTLVSQFVVRCIKPYDLYEKVFKMDTLKNFK